METIQQTNSGAHSGAVQIQKKHLGELRDDETIEDLENAQKFAGGDFALELRGDKLHIFRVLVGERA